MVKQDKKSEEKRVSPRLKMQKYSVMQLMEVIGLSYGQSTQHKTNKIHTFIYKSMSTQASEMPAITWLVLLCFPKGFRDELCQAEHRIGKKTGNIQAFSTRSTVYTYTLNPQPKAGERHFPIAIFKSATSLTVPEICNYRGHLVCSVCVSLRPGAASPQDVHPPGTVLSPPTMSISCLKLCCPPREQIGGPRCATPTVWGFILGTPKSKTCIQVQLLIKLAKKKSLQNCGVFKHEDDLD